jgi:protein-S-isoprenylcysteine O-methyltransferase Ste14
MNPCVKRPIIWIGTSVVGLHQILNTGMKSMSKKIMPTTYLLIALILILLLHFTYPIAHIIKGPWNLIGLIPLVLGIILNLVADRSLKQHHTTVKPFQESNALIVDGAYGISRHPMYLGFVLILIGVSLLVGSISPYIIVLLFAVLVEVVFIRGEEEMLEARFQEAWVQYRSKVRKWI